MTPLGSAIWKNRSPYSPDHAWEFGLERVLDGLGALIERRDRAG